MAEGHTEIEKLQVLAVNGSGGIKYGLFDATGKLVEYVDASSIATKNFVGRSNIREISVDTSLVDINSGKDTFIYGNNKVISLPATSSTVAVGYVETFIFLGAGCTLTNPSSLTVLGLPVGVTFPIALAQLSSIRITRLENSGSPILYIDGDII